MPWGRLSLSSSGLALPPCCWACLFGQAHCIKQGRFYYWPPPCWQPTVRGGQPEQLKKTSAVFRLWPSCLRICNSRNAVSSTSEGAFIIKSSALPFIGKSITSRIFGSSAISITIRSMPGAIPPCGGAPFKGTDHARKLLIHLCPIAGNFKGTIHHLWQMVSNSPA